MINFNFKNLRILSFSAHPDDEIGGAGGLLLQAKKGGSVLKLVLCLDPAEPRMDKTLSQERKIRLKEFKKVAKILNCESSYLGMERYPVISMENILPLVKEIRKFKPDIVITLSDEDYHPDHRAVAMLVKEAIWRAGRNAFPRYGQPFKAKTLIQYEADKPMSNIDFLRDISDVMQEKKKLLGLYDSQINRKDLISAAEGLNRFRGIMYKAGDYAEAFKITEFFYG